MNAKLLTGLTALSILLGGYALLSKKGASHPTNDLDIAKTTAMITNLAGNSGGSGVVYKSTPSSSVLTNAHVCNVARAGGIVSTPLGQGMVTSYKVSKLHDICLIETSVNLGVSTEVADSSPQEMTEATVSGHPQLLRNIITKGNFSGREVIQIMVGIRACSKEDFEGENGMLCIFLGGIPQIKNYRAQVAAPLIQPGSSGSAVFSSSGYISGLVFAGSGQIGFSHIVPWEYVKNFVDKEVQKLESQFPQDAQLEANEQESHKKLRNTCKNTESMDYEIIKDYCKYVDNDLVYYEE